MCPSALCRPPELGAERGGLQQGREVRVCASEGLVRGTSASLLEEVSEARRGVRDVRRWTRPAGCRTLGVRELQGVSSQDRRGRLDLGGWRVLLEIVQFLGAMRSAIDHGSEKAMTFRRRGEIIERAGAGRK